MLNKITMLKLDHYINIFPHLGRNKSKILLLLIAVLFGCSQQQPVAPPAAPSLPVITVIADSVTTFRDYPASIEGSVNVEIRPEISGKLQTLHVDEGAYVEKGQLLFSIDSRPFRERMNNAKAALRSAQGDLTRAKLEIEKLTPLVKNNVVSAYQLKTAEAVKEAAEGALEQARAGVSSAQIDLDYTHIKAPVSGFVGRLNKKQGSLVTPGDAEPLVMLSDIHEVHVYFSMSEEDFIRFKTLYEGRSIQDKLKKIKNVNLVLADNSVYNNSGRIDMVDGQFDKNTGSVTLRATFANPDKTLRSGNTGTVRLGLFHEKSFIVPQEATLEFQDKTFIYVLGDSNKVTRKPITISGTTGTNYLVTKGVSDGTRIVRSGIDNLHEGDKVTPEAGSAKVIANKTLKEN